MRGHRSLRREAAEDAHSVDKVPEERHGDDLIDGLVEGVEGQGEVEEDVGVGGDEGEGAGRCGEEAGVLAEVEEGDGGGGAAEGGEAFSECVPFLWRSEASEASVC